MLSYKLIAYEKYKNIIIVPNFRKSRFDGDFLILMNEKLEMIYLTFIAKEMLSLRSFSEFIKKAKMGMQLAQSVYTK